MSIEQHTLRSWWLQDGKNSLSYLYITVFFWCQKIYLCFSVKVWDNTEHSQLENSAGRSVCMKGKEKEENAGIKKKNCSRELYKQFSLCWKLNSYTVIYHMTSSLYCVWRTISETFLLLYWVLFVGWRFSAIQSCIVFHLCFSIKAQQSFCNSYCSSLLHFGNCSCLPNVG